MFPSESMLQAALASSGSSISSDTNATVNDIKESMDFLVPQQWQVPMVVLVALVGFLAVLGFSSVSEPKAEANAVQSENGKGKHKKEQLSTPTRSKVTTPEGSIITPAGVRRSGRLMSKKNT